VVFHHEYIYLNKITSVTLSLPLFLTAFIASSYRLHTQRNVFRYHSLSLILFSSLAFPNPLKVIF
jgi:hypothetical protein